MSSQIADSAEKYSKIYGQIHEVYGQIHQIHI